MNDNLKAQQVMNDSMSKLRETFQTWLQQRQEQVVNLDTYTPEPSQCQKIPIYYDDDEDEESSIPLRDIIISILPLCIAITLVLSIVEPVDSLIIEDEHLDTISAMKSDEVIKSSIENLVQNPSESEDEFSSSHFALSEYISPYGKVAKTTIHLLTPPKDFHANPNMIIESIPIFPIPVEDSDSLREEIDIFPGPNDSIPPGIENDDYDSKGDDNSTSLPEFESSHVDYPDSGDSTMIWWKTSKLRLLIDEINRNK
ncbi:hypothetical protein Tco_0444601 [Tanacetum coccineum]